PSAEQKLQQIVAANKLPARKNVDDFVWIYKLLRSNKSAAPLIPDVANLALNFESTIETPESDYTPNESFNACIIGLDTLAAIEKVVGGNDESDLGSRLKFVNHPNQFALSAAKAVYLGTDNSTISSRGWVAVQEDLFFAQRVRYLVVIRMLDFRPPQVVSFEAPAQFQRGEMTAEAILCDAKERAMLGSFPFMAANPVDVTIQNAKNSTGAVEGLLRNLDAHANSTLRKALRANFPNAVFPKRWSE
ncbi:MAG: hypothetical protein ACI9HK_003329, partial [Pirellulaceae bacterium]